MVGIWTVGGLAEAGTRQKQCVNLFSGSTAGSFLIGIFRQERSAVMTKQEQQATDRRRSLRQLLDILNNTVPDFVAIVEAAISRA